MTVNVESVIQYGVAALSVYLMYRIVTVYIRRQNQIIERNTEAIRELTNAINMLHRIVNERCDNDADTG